MKLIEKNIRIFETENKLKEIKNQNPNLDVEEEDIDENTKLLIENLVHLLEVENIYTNPDLHRTNLAGMLGISVNKLSSIIKLNWDTNYSDLINEYRIRKAIELLRNPDTTKFSLNGIAQSVGFKQGSNLSMTFKKHIGVSPSYYKNNFKDFKP